MTALFSNHSELPLGTEKISLWLILGLITVAASLQLHDQGLGLLQLVRFYDCCSIPESHDLCALQLVSA